MADTFINLNSATVAPLVPVATATDGSGNNYQKVVVSTDTGGVPAVVNASSPLPVAQQGTATVGGVVSSLATNSGNPVKVGAVYNSSAPTPSSGQVVDLQTDSSGFLKVNIAAGAAAGGTSSNFGSAYPAAGTAIGAKDSNGVNMVALNVDASGFLKVNVAAGATQAVVDNSTGFTSGVSQALPIAGFYQTSPTALTSGDFGIPLLAKTRQLRTVVDIDGNANGNLTVAGAIAPATPAATALKASAGALAFVQASNDTAGPYYLKFWNTASGSVTLGTTAALFQFEIPGNSSSAGAGFVIPLTIPIPFSTAITYAVTGAISLTDNTSITASKVNLVFGYA